MSTSLIIMAILASLSLLLLESSEQLTLGERRFSGDVVEWAMVGLIGIAIVLGIVAFVTVFP